jgi:hypothetical protein
MRGISPGLRRRAGLALVATLLIAAPACAALGVLDDVMVPDGRNSLVTGEVRSVDGRRGRLQVRDDRTSRTHTLRYDGRTRVQYRQRHYPASALERGDVVRVRVSYDRSGTAWADHVEVRQSVQDRRAATARVQRLDGRVLQVDSRRGFFTVEPSRNRTVVIHVGNVTANDARRVARLRRGDRVRMDVRPVTNNAAQLVRFR